MADAEVECKDEPCDFDDDDPYFWYVNGHDCEPFNLNRAPGAVPFEQPAFSRMVIGGGFASLLRRYSVMVCRVYWQQLAWDGHQRYGARIKFPLNVTMALSVVLGCDVTRCRHIDVYHYFADVFGFTDCRYLLGGRPEMASDLSSLSRFLGLHDDSICAGPAVPKILRLEYEK